MMTQINYKKDIKSMKLKLTIIIVIKFSSLLIVMGFNTLLFSHFQYE